MEMGCDLQLSEEKGVQGYLVQCANNHSTGSPFQQTKTLKVLQKMMDGQC